MQYKCTIVGVAVQRYAVVHCDIDRFNATFLYSYSHLFGNLRNKGKDMDSPFENLVIFGDYFLVRCDVYSIKGAYAFRRFFLLPV